MKNEFFPPFGTLWIGRGLDECIQFVWNTILYPRLADFSFSRWNSRKEVKFRALMHATCFPFTVYSEFRFDLEQLWLLQYRFPSCFHSRNLELRVGWRTDSTYIQLMSVSRFGHYSWCVRGERWCEWRNFKLDRKFWFGSGIHYHFRI